MNQRVMESMVLLTRTSLKRTVLAPHMLNIYLIIAITTIGAILRFYTLEHPNLGNDEAASILVARQGFYDIGNPPLSFVILRMILETLGTNEFTARLPSCLFGIATIPLVFLFGKQLFGERDGLMASFIISLSPWYVRWSQQVRMYTELTVFTILALYFFYQAAHKENITFYVLSAVFTILAFYTHYSAVLIVVIITAWVISKKFLENKESSINYKHLMIFLGLFFVFALPLLFTTIPQILKFKIGASGFRWGESINNYLFYLLRYALGPILSLFSIFGALYLIFQRNSAGYLLAAYAAIPTFTFAWLTFIMNVAVRYVIFTLPAFALLASHLIIEFFDRIMKSENKKEFRIVLLKNMKLNTFLAFVFLFIIAIRIDNLSALYQYYSKEDTGWKSACAYVESMMEPEDLIATTGDKVVHYYLGKVDFNLSVELFEPNVYEEIKNSDERVWLLITEMLGQLDPDDEFRDWLDSDCEKMKEVNEVTVYRFTPQNK